MDMSMIPKVRVVIQSRLSSSRLPAKALLPIGGMPSVVLCAKRAANTGLDVVVATSDAASDDLLAEQLALAGITFVRGPLEDVLQRFLEATADLPQDALVIRLTADNVFPDGLFIEEVISNLYSRGGAYLGTFSPLDGLPYGMSAEAFTVQALREAGEKALSKYEREHVTPWIRTTYGAPVFVPAKLQPQLNRLRCTMDNFDDFIRVARVFKAENDPVKVPWQLLCERLAALPEAPTARVPFRIVNNKIHSEMTLGTVQFGLAYGIVNQTGLPSGEESLRIIRSAIEHGVTSLDCARAYGLAESRVGQALSGGWAERASVVTKLDPLAELLPTESTKAVCAAVEASIFRSCRELGVKHLDTVLLHRWSHRSSHQGAIWHRLAELQKEGIIKTLGASVQSAEEALEALRDEAVGHIQLPYNILDWRWKARGVDQLAYTRPDVVIHARSTLLQGILAAPPAAWPKLPEVEPAVWTAKIQSVAQALERQDIVDLCFAYVRAQPWITSVVAGLETLTQLFENIRLFQNKPLTVEECAFLEENVQGAPEILLNPALWPR